ncbi:MAG: hypothetical protein JWQ22_3089 [Devosia sp.]|nr:hypothetical protein [Devosia sp.]
MSRLESIKKVSRNGAAISSKLGEHLLVQPDVHCCGVVGVPFITKLGR